MKLAKSYKFININLRFIIFLFILSFKVGATAPVPPMYYRVSAEQGVPVTLFYAVILNESRSLVSARGHKTILPWPWTINHRGKALFFPNRQAAYAYAQDLIDQGDHQFDVGLGQLNWRWQRQRFANVWQAFDPYLNLTAAAMHFREQFNRPACNTWVLAVGCYHRPAQGVADKAIAKAYTQRVLALWEDL